MKVLVVIVNYKVTDLTLDCLASLAPEVASVPGSHVALVENGTSPADAQRLADAIHQNHWSDWVTLTSLPINLGFTGGNNAAIRPALASADPPQYVHLLNADTIVRPGALKALVDFMDQNPTVGIAGSRLEDPDGTPQVSAFRFQNFINEFESNSRWRSLSILFRNFRVGLPIPTANTQVPWLAGASMIIRREVLTAIGPLDEGYYTYFDDIDYCLQAQRAGWPTWYVPNSRVVHLVGRTTGITVKHQRPKRRPQYWFDARRRFFLKSYSPLHAALADLGLIAGLSLWKLKSTLLRLPDPNPEHFLTDAARHSVFRQGFKLRDVQNPAMAAP